MKRGFIFSINKAFGTFLLAVFMMLGILQASAQVSVTATGAGPGPVIYPDLRQAFNAINAGTHTGAVAITVSVTGTVETAAAILNANVLPASYTSVTIKPAAGATPTISGNVANNGLIYLAGTTNVTIDGSNTVGGTSQDLTITNTNGAGGAVVRISNASATAGASGNTIKNCKINTPSPASSYGIVACSRTTYTAHADFANNNNTIQNNLITNAIIGILINGADPAVTATLTATDDNWTITGNNINTIGQKGILFYSASNSAITNNTINNITSSFAGDVSGILVSWTINSLAITGNKINTISNTDGSLPDAPTAQGIYFDVGNAGANITVANNFIANVTAFGFATLASLPNNGHGIYIDLGGGYNIYDNSINMALNQSSAAGTSAAICVDQALISSPLAVGAINLKDNILVNAQTAGAGRYALYVSTAVGTGSAVFASIDYNDYVASGGGVLGNILGVDRTTLAQMITGFGGNVASINLTPVWMSATDLHLQIVSANNGLVSGIPIAGITTDIDNSGRSATVPTMGAHEFLSSIVYTPLTNSCSLGNIVLSGVNILSPAGINMSGSATPRIYYKRTTDPAWNSLPGTFVSGTATNSFWTFNIVASSFSAPALTSGDVVQYFVDAQTITATPIVFANPSAGFTATDVNTITTFPTTPNTYTIQAVTLTGLATSHSVCYDATAAQPVSFAYTGSTGTPNQYTLTWVPAGLPAVTAFAPIVSPFTVNVPAGTAPGTSTGTITIKNSTTLCTQTYTINLIVNPLPATITGPTLICIGGTTTLATTSIGGTWVSSNTAIATVNLTTGIVTGQAAGTAVISYTLPTGCPATRTVTVTTPPGPILGSDHVCINSIDTLTNALPGGTWSSANSTIASVNSLTGEVTGNSVLGSFTTTISYNVNGCPSATKLIHVDTLPSPITGTFGVCPGLTTVLSTASTGGLWSTDSVAHATVGATTGIVTGILQGIAPITYKFTSTGCIMTNTVTIHPAADTISGGNVVCLGGTLNLGNSVTGGTWTTSNSSYVGIDPTGIAHGNTGGASALITYYTPNLCTATLVVSVNTPPATTTGSATVCTGYTTALSNSVPGGTWTSSNIHIATVSPTGVVSGDTAGTVVITYSITACASANYNVTVNQTPKHINGITNLCNGGSTTSLTDSTAGGTWSHCCDTSVAVSSTGVVTGLSIGTVAVITYTVPNGCYTVAPIIVDTLPAPIQGADSVCKFSYTTLVDASEGGVWSSSNGSIATILADTGIVYGAMAGTVNITYTKISGCYRTKPFKVNNPLPASVTFTYSPDLLTPLCVGTPITITAHPVNGGNFATYNWEKFGVSLGVPDTTTTYTYFPTHGDVIEVYMTRSIEICAAPAPAHQALAINVYPNVGPTMTINTTQPTTVSFLGEVVTFYGDVTGGGPSPAYQWYVDGMAISGATNSSFAREVYDNDTVFCHINGNPECPTGTYSNSNAIIIYADYLHSSSLSTVKGSLSLFPNPNTGKFTLSGTVANDNGTVSIDVTNVLGQIVYKGTATVKDGKINEPISIGNNLSAGTYMLRVNAAAENQVFHFVVSE